MRFLHSDSPAWRMAAAARECLGCGLDCCYRGLLGLMRTVHGHEKAPRSDWNEGLFVVEGESGLGGQTGSLVEKVEVVQCELLFNSLCDFNGGLVLLSLAIFFSKLHETGSGLSFDFKHDRVFGGLDCDGLTKGLELLADFGIP